LQLLLPREQPTNIAGLSLSANSSNTANRSSVWLYVSSTARLTEAPAVERDASISNGNRFKLATPNPTICEIGAQEDNQLAVGSPFSYDPRGANSDDSFCGLYKPYPHIETFYSTMQLHTQLSTGSNCRTGEVIKR